MSGYCDNCGWAGCDCVLMPDRTLRRPSELAERSGVAQPCPPSATGCPEARADGQTDADSSGRCPEVNGPAKRNVKLLGLAAAYLRTAANFTEQGWLKEAYMEAEHAQRLLKEVIDATTPDAPQRSGERVLPDNAPDQRPGAKT